MCRVHIYQQIRELYFQTIFKTIAHLFPLPGEQSESQALHMYVCIICLTSYVHDHSLHICAMSCVWQLSPVW